jgi:hypothetical protein
MAFELIPGPANPPAPAKSYTDSSLSLCGVQMQFAVIQEQEVHAQITIMTSVLPSCWSAVICACEPISLFIDVC